MRVLEGQQPEAEQGEQVRRRRPWIARVLIAIAYVVMVAVAVISFLLFALVAFVTFHIVRLVNEEE